MALACPVWELKYCGFFFKGGEGVREWGTWRKTHRTDTRTNKTVTPILQRLWNSKPGNFESSINRSIYHSIALLTWSVRLAHRVITAPSKKQVQTLDQIGNF